MPDLLAIGNALVDVLANEDDSFLDRHGLVKGSMALVDDERAAALYADMSPAVEVSGGMAANTAAGLASLGGSAAFVGKVRDDQLGTVYVHDLRAAGVEFVVPPAPADHPSRTGTSLIVVTPDAQRTMSTNLGIAAEIHVEDVDEQLVARSTLVFAEGFLWDSPPARAAVEHAYAVARANGAKVAFTLADSFCVQRHHDAFRELLAGTVDVLFANELEALALTGADDLDAAVDAIAGMVPTAFVTCGPKGAYAVGGTERHHVAPFPVEEVVDTTGAGDLFAGGALYGLARGADLRTCALLGCLAASEVISHVGARPRTSLRQLADEHGLP